MGAAAIPYVIAAVGAASSISAQRSQAKQQRRILNASLDRSENATRKATALVDREGQNFAPDARRAALEQQEQVALNQSKADLAGAGANVIDTAGGGGNVSADFVKTQADRQISEGQRLTSLAKESAKTRAPSLLGESDAQRRANLAGELQNSFSSNRNQSAAAGLDAGAVQQPAYGQIGSLLSSLGSAYVAGNSGSPSVFGGQNPGFSGTQQPAPIINMSYRR